MGISSTAGVCLCSREAGDGKGLDAGLAPPRHSHVGFPQRDEPGGIYDVVCACSARCHLHSSQNLEFLLTLETCLREYNGYKQCLNAVPLGRLRGLGVLRRPKGLVGAVEKSDHSVVGAADAVADCNLRACRKIRTNHVNMPLSVPAEGYACVCVCVCVYERERERER